MRMLAFRYDRLANNTSLLIYSVLLLLVLAILAGCSPDRAGTATENQKPIVTIVNTPPDGARFSRNPDLNWYATDIDGFIDFFRYAVVVETLLVVGGQQVTVEDFINQANDDQFGWETLHVSLDNPQASATVRLYADIDFPVDSFINQYFFIQAQDNLGAGSDIVWRRYSRNNHYPNTHHTSSRVYINARDEFSPSDGISLIWDGADSTDYGRARPPLEFEWRLYGPFLDTASIFANVALENCIWDPTVDSFINCARVPVLNIEALPPVVGDIPQPIAFSRGLNYDRDTTDVWVTDEQITVYNVFEGLGELTKTSQFKFVFWVRARDDGYVPDPTPAFSQFLVIEALFERDVAIYDETQYYASSGRWFPMSIFLAKSIFQNYINNTLYEIYGDGYKPFDTLSRFDVWVANGTFPPDTTSDYFSLTARPQQARDPSIIWRGYAKPSLVDLLSHKVQLFYNDDAKGAPEEDPALGLIYHVYFAMDMGAVGWFMGKNLGDVSELYPAGTYGVSSNFASHFGIVSVYQEGWLYETLGRLAVGFPADWNQQYMGCLSLVPSIFPEVSIDVDLLSERYMLLDSVTFFQNIPFVDTFYLDAMPEVGSCTKAPGTAAIYLYESIDGSISRLNGQVMGVAVDNDLYRAATMLFTPIATDTVETQAMFNSVLPWLMDQWLNPTETPKVSAGSFQKGTVGGGLEQRRQNIRRYFEQIEIEAKEHPELLKTLNIEIAPPILLE